MKPSPSVFLKYESIIAALAVVGFAIQWHKKDWQSGLFIFGWLLLLLNVPLLWYAGTAAFKSWRSGVRR